MPRWRLRCKLQEFDVSSGRTLLGRGAECPISFEDELVSRCHAELDVSEDVCTLTDLGSRNGVWLNGERITEPTAVYPNDRIRLGRDEMVLLDGAIQHAEGITSASERRTGRLSCCALCSHEHAVDLASCPSCGLAPGASAAVAEFLQAPESTEVRLSARALRAVAARSEASPGDTAQSGMRPRFDLGPVALARRATG